MPIEIEEAGFPGCYLIRPLAFHDSRGGFVKTYMRSTFIENGLNVDFSEEFYSVSKKDVLRGFHFQLPPDDHMKMVSCVYGKILDVIFDIRRGSPSYGECRSFILDSERPITIYIDTGVAHAFLVLSEMAIVSYRVSTEHSPQNDSGLHWQSAGFSWPVEKPIISAKDASLPYFKEWKSPFIFHGK